MPDRSMGELAAETSRILRDEWNPIGFSDSLPRDEYDSYSHNALALAISGDVEALANYLEWVTVSQIGFAFSNREKDLRVAQLIIDMYKASRSPE